MDPHNLKYTKNSDHSFQLASVELKHQSGCALCWIHSMVVVTSPMGLHAPPALADTTTRPPQACRHSCPESKWVLGRFRNLPIIKTSGSRIAGKGNQDCSTNNCSCEALPCDKTPTHTKKLWGTTRCRIFTQTIVACGAQFATGLLPAKLSAFKAGFIDDLGWFMHSMEGLMLIPKAPSHFPTG